MGRHLKPVIETSRRCYKCKQVKPLSEYHRSKNDRLGHARLCKPCVFNFNRWDRIKREHGVSKSEYEMTYKKQNGVCAICYEKEVYKYRNSLVDLPRGLAVDHNHKTQKFRGLLCRQCNMGLGVFKDDIKRLQSAIAYLEFYRG